MNKLISFKAAGPQAEDPEAGICAETKDKLAGLNEYDELDGKSFLPQNPWLRWFLIVLLSMMPCFIVLVYTFIFQILFFSIAFLLYVAVMVVLLFRVRARPLHCNQQKKLLWFYIVINSLLISVGIYYVVMPAVAMSLRTETVVMGGLTSSTINLSVFADQEAGFSLRTKVSGAAEFSSESSVVGMDETLRLTGLNASTKYEYQVIFQTAGASRPGPTGSFKTLPSTSSEKVTFASTSCAMKNRMVGGVELEAYSRIRKSAPDLDFLIFLGDFVYVDVPFGVGYSGIGFGENREFYDAEYRRTMDDKHVNSFLKNVPSFFMFDDHEINNDISEMSYDHPTMNTAVSSWERYLGNVNPPYMRNASELKGLHFKFDAGAAHVFMTDSRTLRNESAGVVIGEQQLADLQLWLLDMQQRFPKEWKFIGSTPGVSHNEGPINWSCKCPKCAEMTDANRDTCPDELDTGILKFVADNNITGVVFLSGDTHKPGVYELAPGVIEFSASPIHGIGPNPFPTAPDRVLYDETNLLEVWQIVEVEGNKLNIKIFGGGYQPLALIAAWVFGTLLAMWVGAVLILKSAPEGDKIPHVLRDPRSASVIVLLLVSVICLSLAYVLEPFYEHQFDKPIFEYSHAL